MAPRAASAPLLPALVPARSTACSIVSHVNTPKMQGTPVFIAAVNGSDECLPALLRHKPALERKTEAGATPLIIAAHLGRDRTVRTLLEHGARIDNPDNRGITALMAAASKRRDSTVQLMLEFGADPTLRCQRGHTAWDYAVHNGAIDVLNVLVPFDRRTDAPRRTGQ